jgi:cation diffusion facilitator family transporter
MSDCCVNTACEIDKLRGRQRLTLIAVLGINLVMFVVEIAAGLVASSTALVADSLDMLGDALVYGFSLYVVARNEVWKAGSALVKGSIMGLFGLFAIGQVVYKILNPELPHFETIGLVGLIALLANSLCLWMLWRHRDDDINMRSVWLCSRNDIIANSAVLGAAAGVWFSHSQWPDIIVGLAIAALFLRSSSGVIREALAVYRTHHAARTQ